MTSLQSDELTKVKDLFREAAQGKSFDTYSLNAISADSSNPAWTRVREYMNTLATKYNHDASTFAINPNTGEITGSSR